MKRRSVELFGTALAKHARRTSTYDDTEQGVTIVTVNWNTLHFLETLVDAVHARTTTRHHLIVIDNASTDGSREFLRSRPDIESVLLPVNIGHGRALDIGCARARTPHIALLDVDAFPITSDWLDRSFNQLDSGFKVSGAHLSRNFIHPCFLVFRRDLLRNIGVGFAPIGRTSAGSDFGLFLDVGEAFSQAIAVEFGTAALDKIPVTERFGPGDRQAVFGHAVFHNFYSTYGPGRLDAVQRFDSAVEKFGLAGDRARTLRLRSTGS